MNARSCQLCGKPISRLRVGGDGEFCSREHRNQHRLRRGMDRLEEANKVTSLMRRRENPRHISAARLMCNSALERRGFFESKQPALNAGAFSRVLAGPAEPRIGGGADRCLPPRVTRLSGTGVWRWADTSRSRIDGRGTLHRSEEHTSELQSLRHLVCRLLLEKKHNNTVTAPVLRLVTASTARRLLRRAP